MMKKTILLLSLLFTQLIANVGTITAIKGKASIQRGGESIPATLGFTLQQKDNIFTYDNTKLQIIFKDETIISIGKNSNFSINEYLFEEDQAPVAKFNMLKGAMRTITGGIGKIAPDKFSVITKTTTLGIRGTHFSVVVSEDGSYNAFCTHGAIDIKISNEVFIINKGYFLSISPSGLVEIQAFSPQSLRKMKKRNFTTNKNVAKASSTPFTSKNLSSSNDEQLDATRPDTSGIVITELTEVTTIGVQEEETRDDLSISSLDTLLAGYTDSVSYAGTYAVTQQNSSLNPNGNATLDINFGADTINLVIGSGGIYNEQYNINPLFSSTGFTVNGVGLQSGGDSIATGTFQGTTGNQVTGTFNGDFEGSLPTTGVYDVSTSQVIK